MDCGCRCWPTYDSTFWWAECQAYTHNTWYYDGQLPGWKAIIVWKSVWNHLQPLWPTNVHIIDSGAFNLFSITKMMKQGWALQGDATDPFIQKRKQKVDFDIVVPTAEGLVLWMSLPTIWHHCSNQRLSQNNSHHHLAGSWQVRAHPWHPSPTQCNSLGWNLRSRKLAPCPDFAAYTAWQKNLPTLLRNQPQVILIPTSTVFIFTWFCQTYQKHVWSQEIPVAIVGPWNNPTEVLCILIIQECNGGTHLWTLTLLVWGRMGSDAHEIR